ncbi:hypothetical protein Adt_33089 [Abeliophyllum distichum]|uniref:Uncharacterized protein n=1 Tax=Abeliophyllum distichum TaxID=126358 RepID=A0ABD1QV81_9LAMI
MVVAAESDVKAKYKVELKAMIESLKQARTQKRAAEASQKHAEESQNLAEDRAFMAKTTIAIVKINLEAMIAEKDKQLAEAIEEMDKVRVERVDAKERVVLAYKEELSNTPHVFAARPSFMTASGQQLVKRIRKTHPK